METIQKFRQHQQLWCVLATILHTTGLGLSAFPFTSCTFNMAVTLPNELQHYICHLALTDPGFDNKFIFTLMNINKLWAHFVCSHVYKNYHINKYVTFIGFYLAVVSRRQVLPYGDYIQSLDMTAINKYGVDMRAHELMRRCPNLQSVTLGHPTSLKPITIRWMASHCKQLRTLSIGALESYPFMLECDFSSLVGLRTIIFTTTPLLCSSLLTLPWTLQELHLVRMDTLDTATMVTFFEHHRQRQEQDRDHGRITRLAIERCRRLVDDMTAWIPVHQLNWLSLSGRDIKDDHILAILSMRGDLDTLVLDNTLITTRVLDFVDSFRGEHGDDDGTAGRCRLRIKELVLANNINLPLDKQQSL